MSLRTIMIFPDLENMEVIDNVREKYDPLAKYVRPHITIVFPFEDEMSNEFQAYDLGLQYIPHMTVGKLPDVLKLDKAYEDVKDIECGFFAKIDKISVEMIGENEESLIVIEKHFV